MKIKFKPGDSLMKLAATPALSIVIPTLNEADSLPMLLERVYNSLHAAHIPFEIIIIDDHSTDATAAIAKAADTKYHVRLLQKQGKPGKAYSLLEGFAAARHDVICMIDADLQYPPEAISRMHHKLLFGNADIVITNRTHQQTGALRRLSTKVFHLIFTRFLFGINYDTQSGLKLFKKRVLQDMVITPSAWTFDLEFIVRALENQYVILSEDIVFAKRYAGEPKIHIISATFEMAWQSLKLRRRVATKQIKFQYRQLQPLQQSFNWLLAFTLGLLFLAAITTHSVSAAVTDTLKPAAAVVKKSLEPKTGSSGKRSGGATVDTPVGSVTVPVNTTPTSSATTPTTTTTTDPTTSDQSTTPATTSTTSTTASSSSTPTTSTSSTATSNATGANATKDLQTGSGKNAVYYPSSKLSANKTNRWLSLAGRILEVGVGLIAAAVALIGCRKLARKLGHASTNRRSQNSQLLSESVR